MLRRRGSRGLRAAQESDRQSRRASSTGSMLAEYSSLRQEQFNRTLYQQLMISVEFTAALSIGVLAFNQRADSGSMSPATLLLLPPLSFVLGLGYYEQHRSIMMIGRYVRLVLRPKAHALGTPDVFEWEHYIRKYRRSLLWRLSIRINAPLMFCLPPLGVLAFAAESSLARPGVTGYVWAGELVAVIGLGLTLSLGDWIEARSAGRG
jgi:hypothetical protein